MANTGRTVSKFTKVYIGDATHVAELACYTNDVGQSGVDFTEAVDGSFCQTVKGSLLERGTVMAGPINVMIYADTADQNPHNVLTALQGLPVVLSEAIGIREYPTTGTPAFVYSGTLKSYQAAPSSGMVYGTATLTGAASTQGMNYMQPWGVVLHGLAAASAANTSTADIVDNGAATAAGGYLFYALTSLDGGTATISVDDSADNATYAALTGAATSALAAPGCGIIQLGTTAAVKRYLRWQVALAGGATTCTFYLVFVRG